MEVSGLNIYDTLLQLPLFQGMGQNDLTQVVGHTRFEFSRHEKNDVIVQEGHPCTSMVFLTRGVLSIRSISDNHYVEVVEQVNAPILLQPEHLFGLTQRYSQTFIACSERCDTLSISKEEVNRLLGTFEIFRTNLLNIISTQSQRRARIPWRLHPRSIHEKIVRFFVDHCQYPSGEKSIHMKMQVLATEIGESRLNVSKALHKMEESGLLKVSREHIHIPRMEDFFKL